MSLTSAFLAGPIAHRALHNGHQGQPENSRAAVRAAVEQGYGIEIDLQPSADGVPMVFHDVSLSRPTSNEGSSRNLTASESGRLPLLRGPETVPTLEEVLDLIRGRVPLLVEIKDRDGQVRPDVGPLEEAAAAALRGYQGPVALMSFNPHSMAAMAELAPDLPRGLTTDAFRPENWPSLTRETCNHLRGILDCERVGASFISRQFKDLSRPRVLELKEQGAVILCWTISTLETERRVRPFADNITVEGYPA